jgi:hypothetical protein
MIIILHRKTGRALTDVWPEKSGPPTPRFDAAMAAESLFNSEAAAHRRGTLRRDIGSAALARKTCSGCLRFGQTQPEVAALH